MKLILESSVFIINIGLIIAALRLGQVVSGSVFANIPKYIVVMASALTIHSGVDLFLGGRYQFFLYGLTALIVSLSYLAVMYGIYVVLKRISASGGKP